MAGKWWDNCCLPRRYLHIFFKTVRGTFVSFLFSIFSKRFVEFLVVQLYISTDRAIAWQTYRFI